MADRQPYLGSRTASTTRAPYLGRSTDTPAAAPKKKRGGLLGKVARYSGAEFAGNLAEDIGRTAVGVVPGIYEVGKAVGTDVYQGFRHPLTVQHNPKTLGLVKAAGKQYGDYYGHDVLHHLYEHPLQPALDLATAITGGAGAAAKAGSVAAKAGVISDESRLAKLGQRGTVETRSPRNIATGKGPKRVDITSEKPLQRAGEKGIARVRAAAGGEGIPVPLTKGRVRVGGEVKQYGKQIQQDATRNALGRLTHYEPYERATRRLSSKEWTALHLRAIGIHPDDLAEIWRGTPAESVAADASVRALVLNPSKRMVAAEPQARALSASGESLLKEKRLLKNETAEARPDLTIRQASELLGRPVKQIEGVTPYYFPHTLEPARASSPLTPTGGGKGVPRVPGTTKQNLGVLALGGKIHLRSDVLGPEFRRRVTYVKYDEIHKALIRGAVRVTRQDINERFGGKLPQGWEYVRQRTSTKIPASIRAEGDERIPINQLVPDADDLHDSQLARDGFSTADAAQAHTTGGHYYIVPRSTVKAATGEFTRSSDFTRRFVKQPLSVWRALVLGLRPGFLTNNLVGNSIMYAAKTAGNGAFRDLLGAIIETHGRDVAKKALDNPATPPDLRADLYREFFPEQVRGTFGRTQSPATTPASATASAATRAGKAATGAIPKVTAKVAEDIPRRALIRHFIRTSPEFRKVHASLPKDVRTFEKTARALLEGKGGAAFQRRVSKQVNDSLGNYLGLSAAERNVLRNTLPFYAWYKAIVTTTFHLAADTPLRANVLGQIGRIGREASDEWLGEVPTFLRGAIGIGDNTDGTRRVLGTQGLNPYATLEQLRRGTTTDIESLGVNPFVLALGQVYADKTGDGGRVGPPELVGNALAAMATGLPFSRVIKPMPPSRLYPNRNRKSELLGYFGAPVKDYNPAVAAQQARRGR